MPVSFPAAKKRGVTDEPPWAKQAREERERARRGEAPTILMKPDEIELLGWVCKDAGDDALGGYFALTGAASHNKRPGITLMRGELIGGMGGRALAIAADSVEQWVPLEQMEGYFRVNARGDPLLDDDTGIGVVLAKVLDMSALETTELPVFGMKHLPTTDADDAGSW